MSVTVMSKVFECSKTEGYARLVLLALADCANDDGVSWPSISKIAEKANVSEPTAKKYIMAMVAMGLIEKDDRFDKIGRQTSNMYSINIEMIGKDFIAKEAILSVLPPSRKGSPLTSVSGGGANSSYHGGPLTEVSPSYMNHQSEPSNEPSLARRVAENQEGPEQPELIPSRPKKEQSASEARSEATSESKVRLPRIASKLQQQLRDAQARICRFFPRNPKTPWSQKELTALKAILHTDPAEWEAVEEYYRHRGEDGYYCRTSIITMLNNWGREIEKAQGKAGEAERMEQERFKRDFAGMYTP